MWGWNALIMLWLTSMLSKANEAREQRWLTLLLSILLIFRPCGVWFQGLEELLFYSIALPLLSFHLDSSRWRKQIFDSSRRLFNSLSHSSQTFETENSWTGVQTFLCSMKKSIKLSWIWRNKILRLSSAFFPHKIVRDETRWPRNKASLWGSRNMVAGLDCMFDFAVKFDEVRSGNLQQTDSISSFC